MSRFLNQAEMLWLHIPRTGGEWIEKAISVMDIQYTPWRWRMTYGVPRRHALLRHYDRRAMCRVKLSAAMIRNPVDYYISVWRHLSQAGPKNREKLIQTFRWHPHADVCRMWSSKFETWASQVCYELPGWYSRIVDLYVGPNGGEFSTYIGRTEYLVEDFKTIMTFVGYKSNLEANRHKISAIGRVNGSPSIPKPSVTDNITDLIEKSEHEILDRFYGNNERKIVFK